MRVLPPDLASHILQSTTSLATCILLTLRDGAEFGFTEHDSDLVVSGKTYVAAAGYVPSQIANKADLSVDTVDFNAILDSDTLDRNDLLWGRYDGAAIEISLVDWEDTTAGQIILGRGVLGEISLADSMFAAEVRFLGQHLSAVIGRVVGRECDVKVFGDSRCKVDLGPLTDDVTVTSVVNDYKRFYTDSGAAENRYRYGKATFTRGANVGQSFGIASHAADGLITFYGRTPGVIAPGDDVTIVPGCDRLSATCQGFNNYVNFQGFPFVPGMDSIFETPDAK